MLFRSIVERELVSGTAGRDSITEIARYAKLELENDTVSIPKLIIWDRSTGRDKAFCKIFNVNPVYLITRFTRKGRKSERINYVPNYPMFFDEQRNNGGTKNIKFLGATIASFENDPQPNLYQFYANENPRIRKDRNKGYEITFKFDCDQFNSFNINKGFEVSEFGVGVIDCASFDFKKKEVTINGKI